MDLKGESLSCPPQPTAPLLELHALKLYNHLKFIMKILICARNKNQGKEPLKNSGFLRWPGKKGVGFAGMAFVGMGGNPPCPRAEGCF
jgi:hypothetical protein